MSSRPREASGKATVSNRLAALDGTVTALLFLFALVQPVSLAATHIAYATLALVWIVRLLAMRLAGLESSSLDLPLLIFWVWMAVSSSFSLAPQLSWLGMRKINLVFLVLLVAHNVRGTKRAKQLVAVLFFSGLVTVAWTGWQYLAGIGLEVNRVGTDTPFYRSGLRNGDVVLRVDGHVFRNPESFLAYLNARRQDKPLRLVVVRGESDPWRLVIPAHSLAVRRGPDGLGMQITSARRFRARGFYGQGHWTSYSQVLQLLAALAFGLWLANPHRSSPLGLSLAAVGLAFLLALGATLARSAWLAVALGWAVQVALSTRQRWVRALLIPALLIAAFATNEGIRHWRGVSLISLRDPSVDYRLLMWKDGLRLIEQHPWFGVGMKVIPTYWREFSLAAYQKYGYRHDFHSTPIELAVDSGLPAVAAWLLLMLAYLRMLVRLVEQGRKRQDPSLYGFGLGLLGGTAGFLVSSAVNNNFFDSEVIFLFWFLMGLGIALERELEQRTSARPSSQKHNGNCAEQDPQIKP
jgi:O-Antigen ligase/PDZ domain